MTYDIKIYDTRPDNLARFTLGTFGEKPLFVIGLNPSTADDKTPDRTITKVMGFANRHECDSFVMLNLYAQRVTYPDNLHKVMDRELHFENISYILKLLDQVNKPIVLAAWGETISIREYLKFCLADIYEKTKDKNIKWLQIGDLTVSGHPRHPSRAPYSKLNNFDIGKYLMKSTTTTANSDLPNVGRSESQR